VRVSCLCPLVLFARLVVSAQDFQVLQNKTSEFTLPNGLHFIVLQRQESPVVAFHTFVNVGSMQDPGGQTGLCCVEVECLSNEFHLTFATISVTLTLTIICGSNPSRS